MSTEEARPFLENASIPAKAHSIKAQAFTISVITNGVLFLTCLLLIINSSQLSARGLVTTNGEITELYSPANAVIGYEYRSMVANDSRFTGHPGEEWKKNMEELLSGTLLRVSEEELNGSESVPLKDGGYAVGLGVSHSLHCIKKIKKFIYREQFYSDLDPRGEQFEYIQNHADHCLDFLRQSVLCHVDYSMYTLFWAERRHDIPMHNVPEKQKCVDWKNLHAWMLERAANTAMLVSPWN